MSKYYVEYTPDMPTVDPDKEDEMFEEGETVILREYFATMPDGSNKHHIKLPDGYIVDVKTSGKSQCPVIAKSGCDHSWTSYTGLSESFEYCTICDEKR